MCTSSLDSSRYLVPFMAAQSYPVLLARISVHLLPTQHTYFSPSFPSILELQKNGVIEDDEFNYYRRGFAVHLITIPPKSHGGYANRYYLPFGHSKWIGRGRHAFCIFKLLFIWINKGAHGAAKKKKVAKKRVDKKKQHLCLDSFLGFKIIFIFLQFMTRSGQTGRCTGLHASTKLCNDRGITVLDPKWKILLKCTDCTIWAFF